MPIRCPACGKQTREDQCPRCETDLVILRQIQNAARCQTAAGLEHLKQGRAAQALACAETAWRLKQSLAAARLAFMAALSLKRFDAASKWYQIAESF
jgi:hypothetical protein